MKAYAFPFSADIGGTAGLFLGASLLTVMEMGEFLLMSAVSFFKHLKGVGKLKRKCDEKQSQENNGRTTIDQTGIYGTIFSIDKSDSLTNVKKIKVKEKPLKWDEYMESQALKLDCTPGEQTLVQ